MMLLREAESNYRSGQFFRASRYAFAASEGEASQEFMVRPQAYSWITVSLIKAGLYQASSYFFIRTLQSGEKASIRRVLGETETLLVHLGPDLIRKYLIQYTKYEDYDAKNRSAYLYSLGKEALLVGQMDKAVGYINGIQPSSPLAPFALQLRATALAVSGKNEQALEDFRACQKRSEDVIEPGSERSLRVRQSKREAEDLEARCRAGEARTQYQMNQFDEADRTYDRIPKKSLVWPDILFEQAWNSYGKNEFNRTLGKLVSYKSPALQFVYNSEVDVLNAQTYLGLCLYEDTQKVMDEFTLKYTKMGEQVKRFVERTGDNLPGFYDFGKEALKAPLYTKDETFRMANRFVRGPYFQNLVVSEQDIANEMRAIRNFDAGEGNISTGAGRGFPGFLDQVLRWRVKTIRQLGGAFVKNSLLDHHQALIADFEKMSFIKLEMLRRAKEKLMTKRLSNASDRTRGNVEPKRRGDQYYWNFNGEFWNDELGDYVFGLESECGKG